MNNPPPILGLRDKRTNKSSTMRELLQQHHERIAATAQLQVTLFAVPIDTLPTALQGRSAQSG